MKAITPTVTLILLIIILIIIIGFSFTAFQKTVESGGTAAKQTIETQKESLQSCLRVESAAGDTLYIRNCGSNDLTNIAVYANGIPVDIIGSVNIPPNSIGDVIIDTTGLVGEYTIEVKSAYSESSIIHTLNGTSSPTGPYVLSELLGRVTTSSATVNAINRFNETLDIKIQSYSSSPPGTEQEITSINANDTAEFTIATSGGQWKYRLGYNNGSGYVYGPERTFTTQRTSGEFNFTLFSDSHVSVDYDDFMRCRNVSDMIGKANSELTIALGDNIQTTADPEFSYIRLRECLNITHSSIPFYAVIGNHEMEGGYGSFNVNAYNNRTKYIPNPDDTTYSQGGSANENYYAFMWGDVLFIVLDIERYTSDDNVYGWSLGQTQLDWFNATVQSPAKWKFVFIHHPAGGNAPSVGATNYGRGGGRAAYVGNQSVIHQIMKENNVSVLFHGHDHMFFDMKVDGIHYTMPGTTSFTMGGNGGYEETGLPYWREHGYAIVEVKTNRVIVNFVNLTGDIINTYTIMEDNSDRKAPQFVNYIPIQYSSPSSDIDVRVNVTDNIAVDHAILYYRHVNENDYDFNPKLMTNIAGNEYNATIPASFVTGNIEYFIHAEDTNGNSIKTNYYNISVGTLDGPYTIMLTNDDVDDYIIYDTCLRFTEPDIYKECEYDGLALTTILLGNNSDTVTNRGYIDFNTSSISDNAVITKIVLNVSRGGPQASPTPVEIKRMAYQGKQYPGSLEKLFNYIGETEIYKTFTPSGDYYSIDLGDVAVTDVKVGLAYDWFSIGLKGDELVVGQQTKPASENNTNVDLRPKLIVTYYDVI